MTRVLALLGLLSIAGCNSSEFPDAKGTPCQAPFANLSRSGANAEDQQILREASTLVVDFKYDGGSVGKGGSLTLSANGKRLAKGHLERTVPAQFSLGEGLDIGMDIGSPIDFTYDLPFVYSGKINSVRIKLGKMDVAPRGRAPAAKQKVAKGKRAKA